MSDKPKSTNGPRDATDGCAEARSVTESNGAAKGRKNGRPLLPVDLREMELDDLPAIFALGERLFRADEVPNLYRTWDEYELVDSFSSDGEYCLVAEHEERIVGFVTGTVIHKRKSAWTYGYLVWLGVEPELDGRGIARRLVARLTELFIDAGVRIMLVDTDADNTRAIDFFSRAGFANPAEHVYMSRNLTAHPEYQRRRTREAEEGKEAKDRNRRAGAASGGAPAESATDGDGRSG